MREAKEGGKAVFFLNATGPIFSLLILVITRTKGAFNNYVDKMRGGGGQKMTATRIPTEKRGFIFFIFMIDIC